MEQEHKQLLLKDLCARLPYGVVIQEKCIEHDETFLPNSEDDRFVIIDIYEGLVVTNSGSWHYIEDIKPYLFPLSSMTEEQCYELSSIRSDFQDCWKYIKTPIPLAICNFEQIEFFHKNHLDYRGLIEKGLANDATGLNIY